jgi:integrase
LATASSIADPRSRRSRGNGEGSIYQRSDGKWCAAISVDAGRRKVLYAKTRQEVTAKLRKAQVDRDNGLPVVSERLTLGQFLDRWLEDAVKPKVSPRTYASYSQLVRLHIKPALGRVPLAKLTPQQVQKWMNDKQGGGLSPRTVCYLRAVLRKALGQALKWGEVARNVATLVDPPRQVEKEIEPFTPDECRHLLDAVRGERLEALYTVALALGLRQGEALGLRWDDVDLDAASLRVRYQLQKIDGVFDFTEPKSPKSRRAISLPPFAVAALREHRVRQLEERLRAGDAWADWGLVFPSVVGTPIEGSNLTKQFHRLLARAGLGRRRFHDLRHTCATLLLLQEVPDRVVMEILGHSQLSMTARYSHVVSAMKKDAAGRMEALLAAR